MDSIKEKAARNLYPIILIAGIAVIVFSLLGIAAIAGWLPPAHSETGINAKPSDPIVPLSQQCPPCGRVTLIRSIEVPEQPTGIGAVAGGLTGALVGNQIGNGDGRTAMTAVGAAGGAYVGHQIEKRVRTRLIHEVTVRLDDGSHRKVTMGHLPAAAVGERVKIQNGQLIALDNG